MNYANHDKVKTKSDIFKSIFIIFLKKQKTAKKARERYQNLSKVVKEKKATIWL